MIDETEAVNFHIGETMFKLCSKFAVDLGRALVCGEFGSSRDVSHMDAKFKSFRAVIERAHG